jgi:hypothetical protein
MALYMYEVAYTPESLAAQIKEPHDRIEAVRPGLEAALNEQRNSQSR